MKGDGSCTLEVIEELEDKVAFLLNQVMALEAFLSTFVMEDAPLKPVRKSKSNGTLQ
jgi:hypothetical protein